jgi:hypothetical protein
MNLHKGMSNTEIETFLKGKGDFIQIDYLDRLAKEDLGIEKRKWVYTKLIEIYQRVKLYTEAARKAAWIADNSLNISEKRRWYLTEFTMYVKAQQFILADNSLKKALSEITFREKAEIREQVRNLYFQQAEDAERKQHRGQAISLYEKLLSLDTSESDRNAVKERLLRLYNELGKIREYSMLKHSIDKPVQRPRYSNEWEPKRLSLKDLGIEID